MLRADPPLSSPLWGLSEGGLASGRGSLPLTDARPWFCVSRRRVQRRQGAGRRRASERAERFPFPGGQRPTLPKPFPLLFSQVPRGAENGGIVASEASFALRESHFASSYRKAHAFFFSLHRSETFTEIGFVQVAHLRKPEGNSALRRCCPAFLEIPCRV
jgi:hypothetical protein